MGKGYNVCTDFFDEDETQKSTFTNPKRHREISNSRQYFTYLEYKPFKSWVDPSKKH